jgi:molybdopterin-guanine dinucleotide biosynthesis protein
MKKEYPSEMTVVEGDVILPMRRRGKTVRLKVHGTSVQAKLEAFEYEVAFVKTMHKVSTYKTPLTDFVVCRSSTCTDVVTPSVRVHYVTILRKRHEVLSLFSLHCNIVMNI